MSEFGITKEGFKRKRLDQLLKEINDEVKSIFGDNFNVSPESPDGQINGVISESNANLWEIAEASYNAFNPSAATGASLSNLVQINGISRLSATSSRVNLTLTGTVGTVIPEGSLVSTEDTSDQFSTEEDITLDNNGEANVFANAVNTGPISALANTITVIDTPITGWSSVNNTEDAKLGTNDETDVELRARRERSVARDSRSMVESILSAVGDLDGVTKVVVLENDTDEIDSDGLPPKSFQVIVEGGLEEDIAEAIWIAKPAGILSFGNTTFKITDSQGIPKNISFSRPTSVDIYVELDITAFQDYPVDGDDLIKQAIEDYANGKLIEGRGFNLSDDVIYTRLYTPINSVKGHEIDALRIGTSPNPTGTDNIIISATEASYFSIDNIVVNS